MKTIFVVDDSDTNLTMAEAVLESKYQVMTMSSAAKMFSLLDKTLPDIILLDIEMPNMDGLDAIKELKTNHLWLDIPVMFLTGRTDPEVEALGFQLGAVDFVTKPFSGPVLLNRIKIHLDIDMIIRERTSQLYRLQNTIVAVLANLVENRDKGTTGHIERTSSYIKIMIEEMRKRGVYSDEISNWDVDKIISSARMHDLGKISVTDIIINKPGKLTDGEFEIMKTHALEGERIIDRIIAKTGGGEFLRNARLFAGFHHEQWDGKGYPHGFKGKEIPLQGRIMAIVDAYDTLISERPYKKALSDDEAVRIIMGSSGTHYDPLLADIIYQARDRFKAVRMEA